MDVDSQVIVASELSNQASDSPHLLLMVNQVKQHTGRPPGEVLADAGYFSEENAKGVWGQGICALIPPDKIRHREWHNPSSPPNGPPDRGASIAERMRYLLKIPWWRERYRKRECSVEPVFGQIKAARGLRQFLLRGLDKVKALWQLECAVHNLLKVYRATRACPQPAG